MTVAGLVAVTAMASQAGAVTGAGAVTRVARPAASAASFGPGHWVQVTAKQLNVSDVGLARGTDGVLHVLWTTDLSASEQDVMDTPITANGQPGARVTVASGVLSASDPGATVTPDGIDAFFSGLTTAGEFTYEKARPLRGGQWSSGVTVPSLPAIANQGSVSAGTGGDGKAWFAYAGSTIVVDHLGQPEKELVSQCCTSNPGLGTDGTSGVTYLAFQASTPHLKGLYVQRLGAATAVGSPVRLPDSATDGPAPQRIGITGRGHGRPGVYIAYELSSASGSQAVGVIQVGSAKPVEIASNFSPLRDILAGQTVSAAPNGRLWVTWWDGDGTPAALFVRVSGVSGLSFGPTAAIRLPSGTSTIWKVYTSAQNGREDVVALLTVRNTTAYFATQVPLPVAKKG